ncbi:MAG TPA: mechanosensitive ion channel [Anaerolineae bacterium]|nr:mechanosensitive ion channel [Anaerolineae bacterium]MCB0180287.1 mechanosensitive ion channel [Anaerolineae bacterium]MCB0223672.1 mechanosensitive ion channel [Anaerolineae bacterium]MCB9106316.1 mechanosensitive ion channel [Anaerolineales bacterium]HRV94821.1 mechanosensitive ion channel [Anaerolineae bacterium]
MEPFINQIWSTVGGFLPSLVGAILVLLVGWLIALIVSWAVGAILNRTSLDNRLARSMGLEKRKSNLKIEPIITTAVFWLIMLFVLVAVFQILGLTIITEPLNGLLSTIFEYAANIAAAGALLLLAWIIATVVKLVVSKLLGATSLDDKLSNQAGLTQEGQTPLSELLANVLYWFIFLLFLPAILGALGMQGLLEPVQDMMTTVLGYLPNVFAAIVFIWLGWLIARIIRQIVVGLLSAAQVDGLGERVGIKPQEGGQSLSEVIGTVVYVLILIPAIIAGLQVLQISAISDPATEMLTTLLQAIPAIFGAAIVLAVTYVIARLVSGLVTTLLKSIGFDRVLGLIGLGRDPAEGGWSPSDVVGYLVLVGLMLFATIEAAEMMGFTIFSVMVAQFLEFAVQVVLAVIIFGLGLYLANLAYRVILSTVNNNANLLAQSARALIIVFVAAMALRQVGVAEDIVNLAFGLSLGAIAVAFALAAGLGSREIAGREIDSLISKIRSADKSQPPSRLTPPS